ncbi:NACHT domain-containing protein [Crossiella sp. SN42]|uniref:NACHT domain-containing protein n=1 Tax=Crossiella sp. SN42 TaxID=2944808 RepID=UPI00207CBEB3|nr:NACHT domain-containing protein [Crossiella sp. SN42]MCO1577487.1 NACHT domain-containing protein [Crossiella sp. SN42]
MGEAVISGLEVLDLGKIIAEKAVTAWLRRHRARKQRTATLAELAAEELASPVQRNKLERLLGNVGGQVAERLELVLETRFRSLPEHEVAAALAGAGDALAEVKLSDELIFATDADGDKLAAHVRSVCPPPAGLAEPAGQLYDIALDQSCRYLAQVIQHLPALPPRALAETLSRLTAQTAQLDELLARVPRSTLHAPRGTDHDAEFTAAYLRHIESTLDSVTLLGLAAHEQPKLALSTAYLSLSVASVLDRHSRATRRRPDRHWFAETGDGGTSSGRVEAALGGADRAFVRGEAGSGKTTLLHWLAVTAARSAFTDQLADWNSCVPFVIRLRGHATGDLPRPEQFLQDAWPARSAEMPELWTHRRLDEGSALLLVDGVDEVPPNRRPQVHAWLSELAREFPKARMVVTARPAAAEAKWLAAEGFTAVTLEPMNREDITRFVACWHQAAQRAHSLPGDPAELPAAQRRLLNQLASRPHLRVLAANPLLCAMLCALNLDQVSELPRNRMELYRRALEMLLETRDLKRGIAGLLDVSRKRVLLRDMAWRLTEANRIELDRARAEEHVARKLLAMPNVTDPAGEILDHLLERSGVLREPVPGKVDFVHRTFQEYLAASEATEQGRIEKLVSQAHLDVWWETIVMACGHAKRTQADALLTEILDRADTEPRRARHLRLLAAACLETVEELDPAVRARVDTLIETHLVPPRSVREAGSLAAIGHRVLRYFPSTVDNLSEASAAATVRAAAFTENEDGLRLLRGYAADPRHRVQEELAAAWRYFEPARYAEEVLAGAPLRDGHIRVRDEHLLSYVDRLTNLRSLELDLESGRHRVPLDVIADLPCLTVIRLDLLPETVDLTPLLEHPLLHTVELFAAEDYRGTELLCRLPRLANLALFCAVPMPDLGFVRELPGLQTLSLDYLGQVEDYSPLDGLTSLWRLNLWREASLASESGRSWPSIRQLLLSRTGAEVLHRLPELMPNLQTLIIDELTAGDLAAVAEFPLHTLEIRDHLAALDLRALAGRELRLRLDRGGSYLGLDELGPGVRISYL